MFGHCFECFAFLAGPLLYGPLRVLQQYELVQCGHEENTTPALCLSRIARRQKKEKRKYMIGTQVSNPFYLHLFHSDFRHFCFVFFTTSHLFQVFSTAYHLDICKQNC